MEPATNLNVAFWACLILAYVIEDNISSVIYMVCALILLILGIVL